MNLVRLPAIIIFLVIFCVLFSGCATAPAPETGILKFESSPSGAEIYFDGEYKGTTPSTISGVAAGSHTLEFRYSGYTTWNSTITVASGTAQFYAALSRESGGVVPDVSVTGTPSGDSFPSKVTVQASKDLMILGDSMTFSGSGIPSEIVILTLYGPGSYNSGIVIAKPKSNSVGLWSYFWNPGTKIQAGTYTIRVVDSSNATSALATFKVIGGGTVTVLPSRYAASPGLTIQFSGICTSGAEIVRLVLVGPGRFTGGIELGTAPVLADHTWSFKYGLDSSMPTGSYTIVAYDVPKTTSGSSTFTVGFTS